MSPLFKETTTQVQLGSIAQLATSNGGMPKLAIPDAEITLDGIPGDWQKNRKYHGGRDRALCLFSEDLYAWLKREHAIDLANGSVGENVTTCGFDLMSLKPGDRLQLGQGEESAIIQIADIRVPCVSLKKWDPRLLKVIKGKSGWVARVLQPGHVSTTDPIALLNDDSD